MTATLRETREIVREEPLMQRPILEALADRRVFLDAATKSVFYKDAADKTFDAATGKPVDGLPGDAQGVRINAICPGTAFSRMVDDWLQGDPENLAQVAGLHPIGRIANPEEIAEAASFVWSVESTRCPVSAASMPIHVDVPETGRIFGATPKRAPSTAAS